MFIGTEKSGAFKSLASSVGGSGQVQRSLKSSIACTGVGLHSGAKVTMTLHPADPGTGIRFVRTDIGGPAAVVPALWSQVGDTRMNTCLVNDHGVQVGTVEHLMSALAGACIDNCLIAIDGPEVPVMDGSAAPFLFLIECAGTVEQVDAPRRFIRVMKRVSVSDGEKTATLVPSSGFSLRFEIDFQSAAINRQEFSVLMSAGAFKSEIARARTFGFEQEVAMLRAAGLARGGSLDNAVVIDSTGSRVLNDGGLRYGDEFVRHKILDAVGDLYLAGAPIMGHFHGVRSGHALNNRLLHALFSDVDAWRWWPAPMAADLSPILMPATAAHGALVVAG